MESLLRGHCQESEGPRRGDASRRVKTSELDSDAE
jgi:hypothetical protein